MIQHDEIMQWLNVAYSMELSIAEILQKDIEDAFDHPELVKRLSDHLEQTRRHAERMKECIQALGGSVSAGKAFLGDLLGYMKGISMEIFRDKVVKNLLTEYTTEHFEIACYSSLIAAAEEIGANQIVTTCRDILLEEQEMAAWLKEQIPVVTRHYLVLEAEAR